MLKKWYILSLILSLIALGVAQQYQNPKANQEIIIQFESTSLSTLKTEKSLAKISKALELIDANAIEITEINNGFFRIAYHSNKAIVSIKHILSEKIDVVFENASSQNQQDYNLEIFKIESGNSNQWDFEGQCVYTQNLKSDRSFNPDVFKFPVLVESVKFQINFKTDYNANKQIAFVADNTSFNVPETRAGPTYKV